ncbi:MAG: BMP family ABC transporter substrate-binding protein [Deltaproteobacteria bacterium]|nr:BMP family ABC transporter substrate-binding protein [Deltaproteobacteria bacterium]
MRRPSITKPFLVLQALLPCSCSLLLDPVITAKPDGGRAGAADTGEEGAADAGGQQEGDLGLPPADLGPTGLGFGQACEGDLDCASRKCRDRRCTESCSAQQPCPDGWRTSCTGEVCRFLTAPPLAGPPKVGFLYVGPVADHGWSKTHDDGRKFLEANLPGVETGCEPSVSSADAPATIDRLLQQGHNVIVGTSFDFVLPVQNRAANNPQANFLICSGFVTSPNLGSFFGRMYQVKWMAGKLAGRMTRSNRVGVVGAVSIPETVRHINAFTHGVRSVNPAAVVLVRWVHNWFDREKEPQVTRQLVEAGADVILSATDTTIPLETARSLRTADDRPVLVIGYDNPDSCNAAPEICLTSAYWSWGPMLVQMIRQMMEGTWDPLLPIWEQMKADPTQSSVYLAPINSTLVPGQVRLEVEGYIRPLSEPGVEGQQLPFQAPVKDNQGRTRLNQGERFSDEDLLRMCWFVEGVVEEMGEDGQPIPAPVPVGCVGDR